MNVEQNILIAWRKAYISEQARDRHDVFAELAGLDRKNAKRLAYKIGYEVSESDIIQAYKQ